MEALITRVLLPLLVVFAILVLAITIFVVYGYLINLISFNKAQAKLRKTINKEVSKNCKELETLINGIFDDLIASAKEIATNSDGLTMNGELDIEQFSDENGEYVMLHNDETGELEKHYVSDLLEETFGKDIADKYKKEHNK